MSNLINRQAAIDAISCDITITGRRNAEIVSETIASFVDRIKALPPAEPQIIYCKDCKRRDNYGCCKHWKGLAMGDIPIATDDNDFCSHAKRRNDVSDEVTE